MRMVQPSVDGTIGLVLGHVCQEGDQGCGGEGEPGLASERQAEPEPRPSVVEHRAQEPTRSQPGDRIHNPQCPYGENQAKEVLVPGSAGTSLPRTAGQQPTRGESEVAQKGI